MRELDSGSPVCRQGPKSSHYQLSAIKSIWGEKVIWMVKYKFERKDTENSVSSDQVFKLARLLRTILSTWICWGCSNCYPELKSKRHYGLRRLGKVKLFFMNNSWYNLLEKLRATQLGAGWKRRRNWQWTTQRTRLTYWIPIIPADSAALCHTSVHA